MLATLLLVVLVLIAAVTDATRHRIYNWTTYPGIIAGALLMVGGAIWERARRISRRVAAARRLGRVDRPSLASWSAARS